ncbi:MAG: class I SAM-dependent methyltransferase [Candidatus Pacearchaeota archaeon]|jgi:predicted O-methyltransferase YrrM
MRLTIDDKEIRRIMEKTHALIWFEEALILNCLSTISKGHIIEIGSFLGGSAILMGKGINNPYKVFTIDPHPRNIYHPWTKEIYKDSYSILKNNIKEENLEDKIIAIKQKSKDAYKKIKFKAGMLYIDGSHNYEDVLTDFILYEEKIKIGGYICFHDTEDYRNLINNKEITDYMNGPTKVVYEKVIKSKRFKNILRIGRISIAIKTKNKGFLENIHDKKLLKGLIK